MTEHASLFLDPASAPAGEASVRITASVTGRDRVTSDSAASPARLLPGGTQRSLDDLGTPLHEVTFVVFDVETTGGVCTRECAGNGRTDWEFVGCAG